MKTTMAEGLCHLWTVVRNMCLGELLEVCNVGIPLKWIFSRQVVHPSASVASDFFLKTPPLEGTHFM